jgi:hypothetical protein
MNYNKLKRDLASIAISGAISYFEQRTKAKAKEREACMEKFRETAKLIRTRQDVLDLKIGDAVYMESGFMGIVAIKTHEKVYAIPAFRKNATNNWYTSQLVLSPDPRRTDSSYMNSINWDIQSDATSYDDGMVNQSRIKDYIERQKDDRIRREDFPAFEYCMRLGEDYYLPAIGELLALQNVILINEILKRYHADEIIPTDGDGVYWSSTDDIYNEYEGNSNYSRQSGANALRIHADGTLKKEVVSKKQDLNILPFYRIHF